MTVNAKTPVAFRQETRRIASQRSTERRDCVEYSRCFDKAAFANRVAVPCRKCKSYVSKEENCESDS